MSRGRDRITAEELLETMGDEEFDDEDLDDMDDEDFEEEVQRRYPAGMRRLSRKREVNHVNGTHATSVSDKKYVLFCEGEGIYQTNTLRRLVFELARRKLKGLLLGD